MPLKTTASIINFIHVAYNGDRTVSPIDIIKSNEGYKALKNDREKFLKSKKILNKNL